jgi:hypothetical protein
VRIRVIVVFCVFVSVLIVCIYSEHISGNRAHPQGRARRRVVRARLHSKLRSGKQRNQLKFQFNDGGRKAAGYKGRAGDCVVRAVAIATELPYREVYDRVNKLAARERTGKRKRGKSNARTGVYKNTTRRLLESLGWRWTPTMEIGSGCKVHLRADELPAGRLIVSVSGHLTAVVDGVVHDTHDPSRRGTRCVYGYWQHKAEG